MAEKQHDTVRTLGLDHPVGCVCFVLRDNHTPARGIMGLMDPRASLAAQGPQARGLLRRPEGCIKPISPRVRV